jgi:biopolymer transport protein ExbD
MARVLSGLLIAALCACSSEENHDPGLLDRIGSAMTRDRREAMEMRRQIERERHELEQMKAQIEAAKRSGLVVSLPNGGSQDIDVTHVSLVISVPASGDPIVQGRALHDDDLDRMFEAAYARDKTTQVVIQADRNASHGTVVGIMEKAKRAGLTRLAISTSPQ